MKLLASISFATAAIAVGIDAVSSDKDPMFDYISMLDGKEDHAKSWD